MKHKIKQTHVVRSLVLAGLMALGIPCVSKAVPYASQVSESGGIVTFRLNEAADNVKIVLTSPNSTIDMGAVERGVTNFSRGGAASYQIQVTKSAAPVWTQISEDTNTFNQFFGIQSVSVNKNPGSTNFGRIYVLDDGGPATGARTTTEGIFVNNPDVTDAFGQGNTGLQAGLSALNIFVGTGTADRYDPFQIEVGDDDYLYISDANDPRGALLRAVPDVTSGEPVLIGVGNTAAPAVHTVVYGLHPQGSLAAGNLKIWTTDGQWPGVFNSILRYDIGGTALPYNAAPTVVVSPGPNASERDSDLDVAADGNIFFTVGIDGGTGPTGVPAVSVYSTNGVLFWNSVIGGAEIFTNVYALKVSPDNTKLAMVRRDRQTWIIGLTNGPNGRIPDIAQSNLVATFAAGQSGGNGRCVNWDLAGNLYVGNRGNERLRIFSPGGTTTATTTSGGTFGITVPANTVTITNSVTSQSESNGTAIVFTVSRTGNTAVPLFTSFLFTGTASNGVDHTAFPTAINFPALVTTTNISVTLSNDSLSEVSETLTVAINSGTNYGVGTPASRTVTILDDDTPEISVALALAESRLLEGYDHSAVGFQLSRKGYLATGVTANIGYSGTATRGADFNGPVTVAVSAGAANTNFSITSLDDEAYEGNESVTVSVSSGAGYNVGSPSTASATVIDDEYPAGAVLFSDNFESDSSANWITNSNDSFADSAADFAFDYSTLYVPAVPGGSTTKGLRFRLNATASPLNSVSASPRGLSVTGDYRMRFKMWINYNGVMFDGGPGSTLHFTTGVGHTPDHANQYSYAGDDGIWFSASGDGGASAISPQGDYTAYAAFDLLNDSTGYYAAGMGADNSGIRLNDHPYYATLWGEDPAPAAQLANYPNQTGLSGPGNMGIAWHTVVITKTNGGVNWAIDGIPMATVPDSLVTLSDNVFVGFMDAFTGTVMDVPAMGFALVENFRVETFLSAPISITSVKVVGGNVEITFTGPPEKVGTDFKLQSSGTVNGTYADDNGATLSTLGTGSFKAVTALNGAIRFYRIKF